MKTNNRDSLPWVSDQCQLREVPPQLKFSKRSLSTPCRLKSFRPDGIESLRFCLKRRLKKHTSPSGTKWPVRLFTRSWVSGRLCQAELPHAQPPLTKNHMPLSLPCQECKGALKREENIQPNHPVKSPARGRKPSVGDLCADEVRTMAKVPKSVDAISHRQPDPGVP